MLGLARNINRHSVWQRTWTRILNKRGRAIGLVIAAIAYGLALIDVFVWRRGAVPPLPSLGPFLKGFILVTLLMSGLAIWARARKHADDRRWMLLKFYGSLLLILGPLCIWLFRLAVEVGLSILGIALLVLGLAAVEAWRGTRHPLPGTQQADRDHSTEPPPTGSR